MSDSRNTPGSPVPSGYGESTGSLEDGTRSHQHLAQGKPKGKVPGEGDSFGVDSTGGERPKSRRERITPDSDR